MRIDSLTRLAAAAVFAVSLLAPFHVASAQQAAPDCSVPREPGGMVRGDRVPAGCVLSGTDESGRRAAPGASHFVACDETIVYTPNTKRVVHENCSRLSKGRLIILMNLLAPSEPGRGFQPIQRHFEPLQRPFGPLSRPFGPVERDFGPLERPFGSAGSGLTAERRPDQNR
jgi:hypothetical protein